MPTDTVLLCCTASVGEYAITRVPITSNQQFNGLVIKSEFKDKLSADFLFNVASTLKEKLKAFCGKTSVDFVSGSNLKSIQIPLPPLAEQRKIAEILRTWDEAIETAEAELKAKQERKRWLMDKLLVGDWAVKKLDDLFELEGSGIDKVILQGEQVVPLVNYMDAYRKRILEPSDITAQTSVSPADLSRCKLQRGDIVLTPSSETPDDIAHSALIDFEPGDAVHSYHLFRLRARSNSAIIHDFRAFFLNHISVRKQFIRICSGTTRFTLTLPGVRGIKVSLPPAEHQKYAAAVLGDATSQESLASQRIEALRTQKRGLMQKLLTGEVWVAA
jgi:type I restriction enzyme S subunit